ncbi:MAG: thymidylate synthase (FAD) [Candidatus Aenigmarchaeota archaeon ex4484_52]|nr:MAG: thymidylate synthase (FAD) [Candidatus Aenigmarchaeota archaeon ex4484_52]
MEVNLISYTIDCDKIPGVAAFTSCSKKNPYELYNTKTKKDTDDFIKRVVAYGHHSVIEHSNFTFSISGISRACSHELVRHRIASYTQQSQRYVKFNELDVVVPPKIKENKQAKKIFDDAIKKSADAYQKLLDLGIKPEDARFCFPNATKTNLLVTMNARSLMNFFAIRCCRRAQWEIHNLAYKMLKLVKEKAPVVFEKAGASCLQKRYCTEGALCCGLAPTFDEIKNGTANESKIKEYTDKMMEDCDLEK